MLPNEENSIELCNGGTYIKGNFYHLDYWRVEFEMRNGTLMILR